jgi:hypothetical protein
MLRLSQAPSYHAFDFFNKNAPEKLTQISPAHGALKAVHSLISSRHQRRQLKRSKLQKAELTKSLTIPIIGFKETIINLSENRL